MHLNFPEQAICDIKLLSQEDKKFKDVVQWSTQLSDGH